MSLSSEGQSLSANQILSIISIVGWDITTSVFEKQTSAIIRNLLSVSILTICPKSAHYSASGYRISSKSKHPLRKYHVISISQDGGRNGWILLPVSYLLMSLHSEGQNLLANQILSRYLKWRLRYNYIRFRNTNVRHIRNLLSVSILTICPKSAHYSASGYQILSKSKQPLRKYDVISISQYGGWILLPVSYLLMSLPSEGQSLLANQILSRYLKWRLIYIFYGNPKWLGKGSIFFQNQECVNILGCSVTFYEYKNVFLMLVN